MRWIARSLAWFGRALSWCVSHSPSFVRVGIGATLGMLWYDVFRIRRDVVLGNLDRAFPEMSRQEKVRLGRRSLIHMGRNLTDYAFLPFLRKGRGNNDLFEFRGTDKLDKALEEGRGALLLTCHLGNGDFACSGLALQGYPVYMVSKFFKLKWLNDMWFGMRRRSGVEFIPPRNSSYALLRALKSNALVVIPLDQFTGPPIGVKTTFFGHETGTAAGLALMAERAKAPVIACYTWRQPDGRHTLNFSERIDVQFGEDHDRSLVEYTQRFNDVLESFVKMHPDQWMWIHKRWKRFVVT
jgi:Kdo2-lipid IVA lauroyltransferase/acyltransferase